MTVTTETQHDQPAEEAAALEELKPAMRFYASPFLELKLVMVPTDDVPVDQKGNTRRVQGKTLFFKEGRYETDEPQEIEFLANHVNRERLFRDVTDDLPKPPATEVLTAITRAAATQDRDEIIRLWQIETENWQRQDVLLAAQSALEALEGTAKTPAKE